MAEEVVAAYATNLFIRSEAEIRRPVVLLMNERTNVYGVLEKHFRETALPPCDRFWRIVRGQWTPMLDTWRPRVNGVQLKVLAGARLPESEEEWAALRGALAGVRQHLRPDTSVDRLHAELRDFVGMVVDWWHNRKKTETGGINGVGSLLKRAASSGLLLGGGLGLPAPAKKPCLEYLPLPQVQPGPHNGTTIYQSTIYAAPEIVQHSLLGRGSGRLPDRLQLSPSVELGPAGPPPPPVQQPQQQQHEGTNHGSGYLQHLTSNSDAQLFGQLFPGGGAGESGEHSPEEHLAHQQASALLPQLDPPAAGSGGLAACYPQSPSGGRREGSADNREGSRPPGPPAPAAEAKCFVTLNVGGHRFLTTSSTLAAVESSYFSKLAQQAAAAAAKGRTSSEFFVDRSGKIFEYVLDYLRSQRFADSASTLPRDERTLALLAREADFYQLPGLADRARATLAAVATAAAAPQRAEDVPATTAADDSAHGGQLLAGRFNSAAPATAQQPPPLLDALFMETGFQESSELGAAQAGLLQQLNAALQAKHAEGFSVVSCQCGTEREGHRRNLHYHVLLRKPAAGLGAACS